MEREPAMWTSPESNSMVSATIGRAMSTLLSARPEKLEAAVSRLDSAPQRSSVASLEESLWILHSYVIDAAKRTKAEVLFTTQDFFFVHHTSCICCMQWKTTGFPLTKEDSFIAHCGAHGKLLKICLLITLQGGFELPTRLAVAAADCTLALTIALTKKDLFSNGSDEKPKQSNSSLSSLPTTWVPGEKRVKPASRCPELSMEMKLLLWDHLDELIILVQKLIAECYEILYQIFDLITLFYLSLVGPSLQLHGFVYKLEGISLTSPWG